MNNIQKMNRTFKQVSQYIKLIMILKGINNIAHAYHCNKFNLVRYRHECVTRSTAVQNNLTVPQQQTPSQVEHLLAHRLHYGTIFQLKLKQLILYHLLYH